MKRTNNKFRNNNYNNQIYSLNYKFDSNSIAGKVSGTALDLIKRYNELAKEAHTNNDYVSAEVFRQYAEHYRKIVTDINEKKMQRSNQQRENERNENSIEEPASSNDNAVVLESGEIPAAEKAETIPAVEVPARLASVTAIETPQTAPAEEKTMSAAASEKKSFTVIEIPTSEAQTLNKTEDGTPEKPKRTYRRKVAAAE